MERRSDAKERRRATMRPARRRARALAFGAFAALMLGACGGGEREIAYSDLKARIEAGQVAEVEASPYAVEAVPTESARAAGAPEAWVAVPLPNDDGLVSLLDRKGVVYRGVPAGRPNPLVIVPVVLAGALLVFGLFWLQRRAARSAAGVDRLRIRDATKGPLDVTFSDVAGADEAKEELEEVVEFLRSPEKFARLGARTPKGVLLVGAPGTGKTLLARAVAGEAGVPFFSISGSEFVEVFVGVGASRVRKLFERAKVKAPCIVFIDELDAAGKRRGSGPMGGHDEREQTLNQLLVEMDGFAATSGIVVMAATNRPEILDPALLRPGRFDRHVVVDRPDRAGREAILRVHAVGIKLAPEVELGEVAKRTPGFVGADLANLLNEAALLAARRDKGAVGMAELDEAIDRVLAGLEKKNRLINEKEREIVAYHEAGHAVVAERAAAAEPVMKVSIVPRGVAALGYMQQLPDERHLLQHDELLDRLAVLLGGRAAEELAFGQVSTGAANDLERATGLARRMVCEFGMSERVGPVTYAAPDSGFLRAPGVDAGRGCSESTSREIDEEVHAFVSGAFDRACRILEGERDALDRVARRLLADDVLDREALVALLGAVQPA